MVWAGSEGALLARPQTQSNLHLNLGKVGPEAMRDVIREFLVSQGWMECKDCGHPYPDGEVEEPRALGEWWDGQTDGDVWDRHRDQLERSAVWTNDLGPFVTTLVERLSEIGTDTLAERFGEGAQTRLVQLHDLARFAIDDEQVRPDTRRTFAVNRLVRAWLPSGVAPRALEDVRRSVAYVLQTTPWKFSLWRAVVRAAARRSPGHSSAEDADSDAQEWLTRQLQRIAHAPGTLNPLSWMHTWPESRVDHRHLAEKDSSWVTLYLSFHRAAFWHALADTIRSLWLHHEQVNSPLGASTPPSPYQWTVRAIPEGQHDRVASFLANFDSWVEILYPVPAPDLGEMVWELDEITAAVLAPVARHEIANAWREVETAEDGLSIPTVLLGPTAAKTRDLLERFGRLGQTVSDSRRLDAHALAHVLFGRRDRRLGDLLFPNQQSPLILGASENPEHAVFCWRSARLFGSHQPRACVIGDSERE